MNRTIDIMRSWLGRHPQTRQWGWFVGLWIASLSTILILTYPLKLLMRLLART